MHHGDLHAWRPDASLVGRPTACDGFFCVVDVVVVVVVVVVVDVVVDVTGGWMN